MGRPDANKWIMLRFRGYDIIDYSDGYGRYLPGENHAPYPLSSRDIFSFRADPEIGFYFRQLLDQEPVSRDTLNGPNAIPVPIFLVFDSEHNPGNFYDLAHPVNQEILIGSLIGEIGSKYANGTSFQIVFHTNSELQSNFQLPYNIVFDHDAPFRYEELISGLGWYKHVAEEGIKLSKHFEIDPRLSEETDIFITSTLRQVRSFYKRKALPKLIILVAPLEYINYYELTQLGSSVLLITDYFYLSPGAEQFFTVFFESIIHDFPLHEALHFALNKQYFKGRDCLLFTTPENNHSLRISDGLESFKDDVAKYANLVNPGNNNTFIDLMRPENGERLNAVRLERDDLPDYFDSVKAMGRQFNRESSGLIPLVDKMRSFRTEIKPQLNELQSQYLALMNDPAFFDDFVEKQQRVVDVTLETINGSLLYVPAEKDIQLKSGRPYRLNVQIGHRAENSIVTGQVDAIDPLLPNPDGKEGHRLDIVIFSKDFNLNSPSLQTVTLPLAGASDVARFIIVPPAEKSTADLRIAIFKDNHLLQGFELNAILEISPVSLERYPVQVTMDISSSEKFNNLDKIAPRDLFIGLNRSGETHTLFIKDKQAVKEVVGLNETLIEDAQRRFNDLLKKVSFDEGIPKFRAPAADTYDKTAFEDAVRQFVRMGADLYDRIFTGADDQLSKALGRIASEPNLAIQIGRYDLNYSFPWPLLYDFPLELPKTGRPEFPVCNGQALNPEEFPHAKCQDGNGCKHNPGLYTYCTDGFWGTRHRVEQLLSSDAPSDTVYALTENAAKKVSYAVNMDDSYCTGLAAKLESDYQAVRTTHSDDLIQSLWDVSQRPATLIVFGHTKTKPKDGEPPEPRILTFPAKTWPDPSKDIPDDKWIFDRLILNKIKRQSRWTANPLPLVMLISCDNTTLNMSSLNSIVAQFYNARAAAVIGTECDITTDIGACFVETVLNGLYNEGLQLGEVLQRFNRHMFENYNPLPFVFTCYGNYNLQTNLTSHEKTPAAAADGLADPRP